MAKLITSYKELLAQREAERIAAAEIKALPELTGSEKQIAWALDIRAEKFERLNEMLTDMTTTDEQLRRKNQIAIQATKNVLASKTESRFWIDNRNTPARKLIAANNLQDALKAEFEKLTAEASATEVDAEEYAVSSEAQDIAVAAEIELATANNAKETIDMTDADKAIAERKTMTRRELFLAAKKEIGYKHNARGAKIWYISYPRYDIRNEEYIGHTPALKRTRKDVEIYLREDYCGLTVDEFLAEQKAWTEEEVAKAIVQMDIDYKSEHIRDKIERESKPIDDDVFSLLPDVDELNDVEGDEDLVLPTLELDETIYFTPIGNEFRVITVGEENVHFFNGQLFLIRSLKYRARWQDGSWFVSLGDRAQFKSDEEFFQIMAERGACTVEPDFATKLAKLQAERDAAQKALVKAQEEYEKIKGKLQGFLADAAYDLAKNLQIINPDGEIRLVTQTGGFSFRPADFDNVYIDSFRDGAEFAFTDWRSRKYTRYDTPAQVEAVIKELAAAVERGDSEFTFLPVA